MQLTEKCVYELLEDNARDFPDKEAYKFTGESLNWAQFKLRVDEAARCISYLGVKKGTHAAIWSSNSLRWVITYFALCKIGAISVLIAPASSVCELSTLIDYADCEYLFIGDSFKQVHTEDSAMKLLNKNGKYYCEKLKAAFRMNRGKGRLSSADDLLKEVPDDYIPVYEKQHCMETINILFTSGTTAMPKGVMLSHYNIVNNSKGIAECMGFDESDRFCLTVPLYHCFGLSGCTLACVHSKTTNIIMTHFQTAAVSDTLLNERCTAFSAVPTMLISLAEHAQANDLSYPLLKKGEIAGAICTEQAFSRIIKYLYSDIMVSYGQTEASPSVTFSLPGDSFEVRATTVGRPMPLVEVKMISLQTGEEVATGESGEICVKGYNVMQGYYKMPEATAKTIDKDGWLHTGDLGYFGDDGNIRITGRIKEMIIRGGDNISPYEIEDALMKLDEISLIKVIGVKDDYYQEEICACIMVKEGKTLTEQQVRDFAAEQLSMFKQPRYILFMDEFPITSSGKVKLADIKEIAEKMIEERKGLK